MIFDYAINVTFSQSSLRFSSRLFFRQVLIYADIIVHTRDVSEITDGEHLNVYMN